MDSVAVAIAIAIAVDVDVDVVFNGGVLSVVLMVSSI